MGPNFRCARGLDRLEIGWHAIVLDKISGVLFLIKACIIVCIYDNMNASVVCMISDALICSLNGYCI